MAQLIQHKRGRLERLSTITGSLQKGEILIVTGSSNITSSNGSAILFAATESGSVQATNRFIIGSSAPNVFPTSTYGGLVNGVPYYDSGSGTLYLLGGDGNTAINLTGNISTFSASVATSFSASNASIASITGDFSSSVAQTFATQSLNLSTLSSSVATSFSSSLASQTQLSSSISGTISALSSSLTETIINTVSSSLSSSLSTIATDLELSVVSSSISASQLLISSSISASIASTLSGSVASIGSLSSSVATSFVSQSVRITSLELFTGSYATTGSNIFKGEQIISSSLIVTNAIKGTGSIFLQPDINDARQIEIYNTGAAPGDVHIKATTGLTFLGDDTNYLAINDSTQTITITGSNGVYVGGIAETVGAFSQSVDSRFSASVASLNTLSSSISQSIVDIVSASLSSSLSVIATDIEVAIVSASLSSSQALISSSISTSIAETLSGSAASVTSLSSSVSTSLATLSSNLAANTGIFLQTGSVYATTNNIEITGSLNVSGTINPDNVTVGIPTANAWQSNLNGSYFNNFNSETNVSEILRFVAGLLSASAPDASPNTKTLSSVTATAQNTTTGTALTGRIPQTSTNTTITYLNGKGFATAGSTIFSGIGTIYTANYGYNYTSVAAGSTNASSSADTQLFGLGNLSSGTPTNFKVSGSFTFRFKDNSTKTDTATSSSVVSITQTGAGTTSGVTLALINTVNPAVIPPGYQDGKFASALGQFIYSGSATAVSASGYYHISSSIQIASGSSAYSTAIAANGTEVFWAPLTTISTNVPVQTSLTGSTTLVSVSATSRSLSGAPYLLTSTYTISSSVTNLFNPLFFNGTVGSIALSGTGVAATSGVNSVATSAGTISTANGVFDTTNTTVRTTSTIPFETDIVRLNGLYTFGSSNITNIAQTSFTPTTWTATMNGVNYNNGSSVSKVNTFNYHTAGDFGQPVGSGSLAYFTRTQSADASTALIESFLGESYRIQLADNVLAFNGTAASTVFGLYTYTSGNDLQVKPGYLVKPGGTYGYWLGDSDTSKTYKYYIRKFTTSGTKSSMTLNMGKTLVNWGTTTNDQVGALILFESSKNTIYTPARLYDPSNLLDNFTATKTANTDGQNPFGANFDLYGNTGGSLSSTTYTIPLRSADGMSLNATYTNIYVIVRYKGDPSPVTSITTTFS